MQPRPAECEKVWFSENSMNDIKDVLYYAPEETMELSTLRDFNGRTGFRLHVVRHVDEVPAGARRKKVAAVLAHLPESAMAPSLIRQLRGMLPEAPIVAWFESAVMADLVEIMQAGANDCVVAPEAERLAAALKAAIRQKESRQPKEETVSSGKGLANIIGSSDKIKAVFSLISRICDTDTTVLIEGESGTGKELIAQALHYEGSRRTGPFVPVNCGAIPADLLESELFGHEKGAFTHAINTRLGRFELANGGTVFLDEISEMSPVLQVKILRVLQEKQFERIGGTRTITSDFRVIAATNRDLEAEVKQGNFREDLYYRLNVIPIKAPPLRERPTDIMPLAEYFTERFDKMKRKRIKGVTPEAQKLLLQYSWPGNVRELENVMERMVILATGPMIGVEDLPERIRSHKTKNYTVEPTAVISNDFNLSDEVATYEKRLIIQALNQTDWVKNRAAQLLRVNRTTLIEKMKRYELKKPQVRLEEH